MVDVPKRPPHHPDRRTDCEIALVDDFVALVGRAEAAGWRSDEVAGALLSLALNYVTSRKQTFSNAKETR